MKRIDRSDHGRNMRAARERSGVEQDAPGYELLAGWFVHPSRAVGLSRTEMPLAVRTTRGSMRKSIAGSLIVA